MADFCSQCSIRNFGEDLGDLANITTEGHYINVICEGCGFTVVDYRGVCVADRCLVIHPLVPTKQLTGD